MDVKQLAAVVATAETGSVTRAAEVLHLVQPAVSRQIKLLEEELGVPLFERTRQGMRLTDDGQVLLDHARRALTELERARAEIRPTSGELRGTVALGLSPSFAEPIAEVLTRRLAAEHPAVRLRLSVGFARHLADRLDAADVDLAVIYEIRPSSAVEVRPLLDEALWVVGPADAELSPDRPVRFADVHERVRVQSPPAHALRRMLERVAADEKIRLAVGVEADSMEVQRRLVAAGLRLRRPARDRRGRRRAAGPPGGRAAARPRPAPPPADRPAGHPPSRLRGAGGGRDPGGGDAGRGRERPLAVGDVAGRHAPAGGQAPLRAYRAAMSACCTTSVRAGCIQ